MLKTKFLIAMLLLSTALCYSIEDQLDLLISAEDIAAKVHQVSAQIDQDYKDKKLTVIMIMKGSLCVTSDLIRQIKVPFILDYVRASSYGENGMKAGELIVSGLDDLPIEGRDVLLIDDIVETGSTMRKVMDKLSEKHPNSIKSLVLLVKDVPRKIAYCPDYTLFHIANRFVVGYGMDYKELYRGLPGIYAFPHDTPPF